jgi:hypothetical protein
MKHGMTFSILFQGCYTEKLARSLKTQVMHLMIEKGAVDEFLVIGSFYIEGQK